MRWHDYPLASKAMAKAVGGSVGLVLAGMEKTLTKVHSAEKVAITNGIAQIRGEQVWTEDKRPYYDIYPSVAEAFTKVDLSKLACDRINLPLQTLLLRFQVGHELKAGHSAVRSVLAIQTQMRDRSSLGLLVSIDTGEKHMTTRGEVVDHTVTAIGLTPNSTILSRLLIGRDPNHTVPGSDVDDEMVNAVFRLVACLCLLNNNPDLISQEPLEADRAKWEATHDPKLLEKAERRGCRRWSIGKHIETAPGFRRPHFAIRWMGHQPNLQPVLRPVKGCLVHREKLQELPTGYLDQAVEAVVYEEEPNAQV